MRHSKIASKLFDTLIIGRKIIGLVFKKVPSIFFINILYYWNKLSLFLIFDIDVVLGDGLTSKHIIKNFSVFPDGDTMAIECAISVSNSIP